MTMNLTGDAFFTAYLRALNSKELQALTEWQEERLAGSPDEATIADALNNKKMIFDEGRRRDGQRH